MYLLLRRLYNEINLKNSKVIETRKDGIKFKSEKLDELNEKFFKHKETYEQTQKTVVDDVLQITSE
jgi:hypothetical protein